MTYQPRPSISGDSLLKSRDTIRGNFEIIQNRFNDNHVDFNDGSGKHKFLQMPEQSSAPTTAANEAGFYAAEANSVAQLFMRRESDGSTLQLTSSDVTDTTAQATNGYTCLPGGLLLQWNTFTATGGTNTTVTFPKAFSAAPYSVVAQMNRDASNVDTIYVHTLTTTNFKARNTSSSNRTAYYIAIGPA